MKNAVGYVSLKPSYVVDLCLAALANILKEREIKISQFEDAAEFKHKRTWFGFGKPRTRQECIQFELDQPFNDGWFAYNAFVTAEEKIQKILESAMDIKDCSGSTMELSVEAHSLLLRWQE